MKENAQMYLDKDLYCYRMKNGFYIENIYIFIFFVVLIIIIIIFLINFFITTNKVDLTNENSTELQA